MYLWVKLPIVIKRHSKADTPVAAAYTARGNFSVSQFTWYLLGAASFIKVTPTSTIDVFRILHDGIPKSAVDHFSQFLDIPMTLMAPLLNMSYKTLIRKKEDEKLEDYVSSHMYEIAATYAMAFGIFQDAGKVTRWFNKENKALNNQKPFDLLNTPTGIKLVTQVLGRLEEGVYS